ncbi:MAG TPA: DUF3426 domain-containing protein [Luteimonas sp.]|nr:DUF3426 domain-containing protein [Luteimonas sp.]
MFVLCPHCQFLVALDPASGQPPARCPRCDGLLLQPPAPAGDEVATQSAPGQAAAATEDTATGDFIDAASAEAADTAIDPAALDPGIAADEAAPQAVPTTSASATTGTRRNAQPTPSFARRPRATATRGARRPWFSIAIAGLALLLALQLLLADRAELARDARWRPPLSSLCSVLRCALPPWHEPTAFTLLNRDVRPHPTVPGVLHVTATFRNDARWPQPWPALLLTLSDLDGRAAGARVFEPRDYLGATPAQRLLANGQSATIVMDVLEPAPHIVAFTFDFR